MTISVMGVMCTAKLLLSGPEKFSTLFFEVFMNMKMKMIAATCVAFCGASAFAAAAPSCVSAIALTDVEHLLKNCTPERTFYAAGATAMKTAIQTVLTTDGVVFDKTKPFVSITMDGDSSTNTYGYYGYLAGAATPTRVAVIVNGVNGSMAGVKQLLSGLKEGSMEGGVDQKEYITMKLHSLADQKLGNPMPVWSAATNLGVKSMTGATTKAGTAVLGSAQVGDFKGAWGGDKQKVAHMAFSDVRPSEATPGQIASWKPASFPSQTIVMQGFGVLVNANMYQQLQTRDINAGRMASACQDDLIKAACQPNIFTADYTALMTGKVTSAADLGLTGTLTLNRRPASSGTQAATQIRFAGESNYVGKTPLNGLTPALSTAAFDMAGAEVTNAGTAVGGITVVTHSGTSGLIAAVKSTTGLQIGVASLDNSPAKLGNNAEFTARASQTAFWVKLDGVSPDFTGSDDLVDGTYRTALTKGYSFAYEFQTLKSVKLAGDYLSIYNKISDELKKPNSALSGVAWIGSTTPALNTVWTRGENNFYPLNKY